MIELLVPATDAGVVAEPTLVSGVVRRARLVVPPQPRRTAGRTCGAEGDGPPADACPGGAPTSQPHALAPPEWAPHAEAVINQAHNPYIYISGVFAAAWVVAAWIRPEADYVAFPALVAGSFPVSYRLALGPLPGHLATGAAAGGAINTIVLALLLEVAGILGGPDLLPSLNPVGQATLLGVAGATVGAIVATVGRPRE